MRSNLLCPHPSCPITFKSQHGRTYHIRTHHIRRPSQIKTIHLKRLHYLRSPHLKLLQYLQQSTHFCAGHGAELGHQDETRGHKRIEHPHLTGKCADILLRVPIHNLIFSSSL